MSSISRIVVGGILAAIILAAAAGAGWWFFIRDDAKLATSAPSIPADLVTPAASTIGATTPGATSAAGTPGAAASTALAVGVPTIAPDAASAAGGTTFSILSDRSEAAYFADEKLASLPLPSTAKGSTKAITGQFHLTADGTALDTSQTSSFTVDLSTLTSDQSRRDARAQSTLDTGTFKTATFTATSATGFDPSVAAGQEQSLTLTGTMDLHGVKKEITWDVKARKQGNIITALATVTFPFEDFGMSAPAIAGFVSVQDHITLQVQIIAQAS